MAFLEETQHNFMAYLRYGDDAGFISMLGGTLVPAEIGARIYHNAYRQRLREVIEADHEMLGHYLGDTLFEQMAAGYIDSHPSHYFSLRDFTTFLPQYLAASEPFNGYPVLAELARFERILLDVFDAPEAEPMGVEALHRVPPEDWPGMRLRLHPSAQLFDCDWNCVEIWRALKAGEVPPDAKQQFGSRWLLWRGRDLLTQFRSIPVEEWASMDAALHGHAFAEICEIIQSYRGDNSESAAATLNYLAYWLDNGIVSALETDGGARPSVLYLIR